MIFIAIMVPYLLVGFLLSLLIERFKKEIIFGGIEGEHIPRSIFTLAWALIAPIWIIIVIIIVIDNAGWYDKLVKKIRGF
jgi:hypothetical protein